jgi:hypothetical protein
VRHDGKVVFDLLVLLECKDDASRQFHLITTRECRHTITIECATKAFVCKVHAYLPKVEQLCLWQKVRIAFVDENQIGQMNACATVIDRMTNQSTNQPINQPINIELSHRGKLLAHVKHNIPRYGMLGGVELRRISRYFWKLPSDVMTSFNTSQMFQVLSGNNCNQSIREVLAHTHTHTHTHSLSLSHEMMHSGVVISDIQPMCYAIARLVSFEGQQ